jgi:glyceraldehyde-3-phosphate dehydrogenase (NAD(P))
MSAKVLVVGYGVVGKRVADAIQAQSDMRLVGIVDVVPSALVDIAAERRYPVFAATAEAAAKMTKGGLRVEGDFDAALGGADLVVDTSPEGVTAKNLPAYERTKKPFIINGGEEKHSVTGFSFSSFANYTQALGKTKTRVVSCNTTSLCRMMVALSSVAAIEDAFVAVVRRGADPVRTALGPINAIEPVLGGFSHHAPDVNTVIPGIKIASLAVKVSSTLSHVHMLRLLFYNTTDRNAIVEALRATPRIILVSGAKGLVSNAHVLELFRDRLRPRGDMWEVGVWEDSIVVDNRTAVLTYCVHMEAVAVPENVDAIRAMLRLEADPGTAIAATDKALGMFRPDANYRSLGNR